MVLTEGMKAPSFSLPDQQGTMHSLQDYVGKQVLLYFYPKDQTPGCTVEACAFRDHWSAFQRLDVHILGISTDSVTSHQKFAQAQSLPFPLLSDVDKSVVQAYGVWGPKKFMGREYLGTQRMSFLIGPDGRIQKIYATVKPAQHATDVLTDVQSPG